MQAISYHLFITPIFIFKMCVGLQSIKLNIIPKQCLTNRSASYGTHEPASCTLLFIVSNEPVQMHGTSSVVYCHYACLPGLYSCEWRRGLVVVSVTFLHPPASSNRAIKIEKQKQNKNKNKNKTKQKKNGTSSVILQRWLNPVVVV